MALKTQQYLNMLMSLMPRGKLWDDLQEDPNFIGLFESAAEELAIIDARESDLLNEADPRSTREMLEDWERAYDLPDPCVDGDLTLEQRLDSLYAKVINKGGQSIDYFIKLAKSLGYDITITEFSPYKVNDPVNKPIYGKNWKFIWRGNAPEVTVTKSTVRSRVNEPLAAWGNERLECSLSRFKPNHTKLIFSYGG